jgi:hypothetical protein
VPKRESRGDHYGARQFAGICTGLQRFTAKTVKWASGDDAEYRRRSCALGASRDRGASLAKIDLRTRGEPTTTGLVSNVTAPTTSRCFELRDEFSRASAQVVATLRVVTTVRYQTKVAGKTRLSAKDIDLLGVQLRANTSALWFDLNNDGVADYADYVEWVHGLKGTYFGDAGMSGEFNSADLALVLAAGEYEDDVVANSGWANGDWDGNGEFTSGDLVVALADGGYEAGPRAAAAVPEPASVLSLLVGLMVVGLRQNRTLLHSDVR